LRLARQHGILTTGRAVLDYGCGHGEDVSLLLGEGIAARGWDPVHRPDGDRSIADVVNLGYVINVIEDPDERLQTVQEAWRLTERVLVISARLTFEDRATGELFGDGVITRRSTFQRYYEQEELRSFISTAIGIEPVPAAPGTFYVFRDDNEREAYQASRFRQRISAPRLRVADRLYQEHQNLFDRLVASLQERGRLPVGDEAAEHEALVSVVGSLRRSFQVVVRVFGSEHWDDVRRRRADDLLVYLALARFRGRPRPRSLSASMQADVTAFFGKYPTACTRADELLFSVGRSDRVEEAVQSMAFGKMTPAALYVHRAGLDRLSPVLRVYEGCAQQLVGSVDGANIIKLYRRGPKVAYLCYPSFDREAHPELLGSLFVDLRSRSVHYRDYAQSENPPILHRKETFVPPDYVLRDRFACLSAQEERHGLLDDTETIGFREHWSALLSARRLVVRGHRLVRSKPTVMEDVTDNGTGIEVGG
jgi:DNA phosphorothioation-associated putative methyltransferase